MPQVATVSAKWSRALRAKGIAVSRHADISVARGPLPLKAHVRTTVPLKRSEIFAVIPDQAFCSITSILDQDEYTLMPQPADLLVANSSANHDADKLAKELDIWYVAHFLSLTVFLQEQCWFSAVLSEIEASSATAEKAPEYLVDLPTVLEMKRKADFATAPANVMLSALHYTRHCRFYTAAEGTTKRVTTVCPLLDFLHLFGNEKSNLCMERLSVTQAALDEIRGRALVGWKQHHGHRKPGDESFFWCLRAARDVEAGELLTLAPSWPREVETASDRANEKTHNH